MSLQIFDDRGRGQVAQTSLGTGEGLTPVVVHWVNVPFMAPLEALTDDTSLWSGRWATESKHWRVVLDTRHALTRAVGQMRSDEHQYAVTYVGELTRPDGHSFSGLEAQEALHAWRVARSFAFGRWVAPAMPVGFDASGHRVWEQWSPWRCDTLFGYQSWWTSSMADDLRAFARSFVDAFLEPSSQATVRHLAFDSIVANHSGTTGEAKVMLAQAGLEFLAWTDLVLTGHMSKAEYNATAAADKLRKLLVAADIGCDVPADLPAALAKAGGTMDGPEAVAWVRNRLVHPKDPGEPYRIQGLVWETSQLALEYLELLLLHRVGYTGRFCRRYPPGRFEGTNEPVPWVAAGPSPP